MLQYSPKIVTDGLVMCLDASNNKSYPAADLPLKDQLNLWLDAADDSTFSYSSGTTVSQWRDKSGQNNHAVVYGGSPLRSVAINSRKAVSFTSTSWFRCLTGSFTSTATHFLVCRSTASSTDYQRVYNGGSDAFVFIGAFSNNIATFWGTGASWNDVNINAPTTTILNTLRIISAINTGAGATPYSDGTAMTVKSTNSAAYTGYGLNSSSGVLSQPLTGEVCEIIVFNKQLSLTELKRVHTYLGQKWGISNTDRSIVDLSNNNNHGLLGNGTVANMPDYNYYNKSLTYNKGQSDTLVVTNSTSLKNNNTTIELYMKFNSAITSNTGDYIQFGLGSGNYGQYYFRNDSPNLTWNWFPASSATSSSAYAISNFSTDTYYLITLTGDSTGASKMYVNGIQVASAAGGISAVTTWTSNNLTIGGYFWDGYSNSDIALTRIYSRVLSVAEISQNYEAIKSRFTNTIVQQGLVLNLDANNPYSYAGAGTTWYDTSGNNYNGALTSSPVYSTDSGGAFTFAGNYSLSPASTVNSLNGDALTVEAWVKHDSFGGAGTGRGYVSNWHSFNTLNQRGFILRTYDTQTNPSFWWCWGGGNNYDAFGPSSYVMQTGRIYHIVATYEKNVAVKIYINGNLEGTGTNSVSNTIAFDTGNGVYVGFSNINNSYMYGNIYSTRLYNRVLSAAEVLQNYNATKGRFGLL